MYLYSPTPIPEKNHTYCFIVCQFQPRFILHCPLTEIDGWGKKRNYNAHKTSSVVGSKIHPFICPSNASIRPGSLSSWLSVQHCSVTDTFLCGSHDTWPVGIFLQIRIRWGLHLPILTAPLHLPHSASPQTSSIRVTFLKYMTMLPSCLNALHWLFSDLRIKVGLLRVVCLVL